MDVVPLLNPPKERELRIDYSIYIVPVAGCMVDDGILGAAEGYNRTMEPLLEKNFNAPLFKDFHTRSKNAQN